MNPLKAAAVLAGPVVVALAATSAVAHGGPGSAADGVTDATKRIGEGAVHGGAHERPVHLVGTPDEGRFAEVTQGSGRPVTQETRFSLLGGLPVD
ncbi:hypothetical protein AB0937_02740 [Streptomyces sp. NPDC047880]|uniref:hypothetical protein n=1 Tax=Streptomyces sp. NPDC047880 TaxID=3155626 RepID=UPI0034553D40